MDALHELLIWLGIKVPDLIAGFLGGVVNAFVFQRQGVVPVIGSMIVGAITANYMASTVGKVFMLSDGPAGFVTGLCGMAICQGVFAVISKWRPTQGPGQ